MGALNGKIAIVTGASKGIGRELALALAAAGCKVVAVARTKDLVEDTAQKCREAGAEAAAYTADVTKFDQAEAIAGEVADKFGRIDILVNNAGVTRDNLLLRMSEEEWQHVMDTNLKGAFNWTKAVARHMLRQKSGRILNISSVVGVVGNAGQANYAASKAGILGLTKSAAKELASRGITVNAVAPGFITTGMTAGLRQEAKDAALKAIPLGRFGEARDIAAAVCFLASDGAAYITGQVLQVDGGMAM
jgi:3-oxoacyl-[acyl-carrier protein] reductase